MGELVCSGGTLGKSGSEVSSQLEGQIARAFSSNSLVNTMDMTAAIQYILTAAQSLGSQVYYKRSLMTILGLAGVLFCENEQALTKWIIICSEENTYLDAQGSYHFIRIVFFLFFFSVSFSQILVFLGKLCLKACQHILDIVGLSQAEV